MSIQTIPTAMVYSGVQYRFVSSLAAKMEERNVKEIFTASMYYICIKNFLFYQNHGRKNEFF